MRKRITRKVFNFVANLNIMARYFIQLGYNGGKYNGWQIQKNSNTIQAEVNSALSLYLGGKINVIGCGRTDAGVHAKFFVAHFDCDNQKLETDSEKHIYKINSILPKNIVVYKIKRMHDGANSRFDATMRTYSYFMHKGKNPFKNEFSVQIFGNIDVELMNKAAKKLSEYTDFTSFSKLHSDVKTNNCKIYEAKWIATEDEIVFTISADRFLRNMVRAIVGTLIEVGKNKISIDDFCKIIEKKNRSAAGISTLAKGLFLVDVKYPYDIQ